MGYTNTVLGGRGSYLGTLPLLWECLGVNFHVDECRCKVLKELKSTIM